ncbi:MAG: iron dependent repressor, metal binding and dimerization domain protein, partial [Planctomycetota bacterium]
DDVVAYLFRGEERSRSEIKMNELSRELLAAPITLRFATWWLKTDGSLRKEVDLSLTEKGRERGKQLVRSHRLWEQYLVDQAGSDVDRIHGSAERFEHFTDRQMREQLSEQTDTPQQDPHGRPIPEEQD